MTPGQILAAILLAMVIGFGGAWQVQDWRMGKKLAEQAGLHKDDLAAITNAAAAQTRVEQDKRLALEQQLAGQGPTTHQGIIRCPTQPGCSARSPCHF